MIHELLPKMTDQVGYSGEASPIGYVNIYNYSIFRKHPEIISGFEQFTLDGIFLVWMMRLLFGKRIQRKSPDFSSYFTELFKWLNQQGKKAAFVGGNQDEIQIFTGLVTAKYPRIQTILTANGYEKNEKEVLDNILDKSPDIVLLGMGSPKQELFALLLKERRYSGSIITCGAFISQTATGGEEYYPKWTNKLNVRWVYRIFREPALFRRYFFQYPAALLVLLKDYYCGPASK